ncbi:MAG: Ig domain-containing protein [Bacteroidales bacterium]|nr:MAG: Ig domain-containing protein [Bacteroidales bacterium]
MKKIYLSLFLIALVLKSITSCKKEDVSVTGVELSSSTLTIKVGETSTLVANVLPADADVKSVTWGSSDITVAAVDNSGSVIGIKIGTATITVTSTDGAKTATCAINVIQAGNEKIIQGEIKNTRNLVADSTYLLKGFVYVVDGATLNIAAGTIIKGDKATMGSLIVEKGGKINAIGTSTSPIVFTSNQPTGGRTYGDWGGLVICGKAAINQTGGTSQVEGGPRSTYGGGTSPNNADNSGTLKYVRIEFAGYPFQPDKEINGLTLAGVGSGTTIDYIQVSYCGDDSYEWFGGTVNCKHLIAFRGIDDEFDTDNGYSGKLQFLLGLRDYRKADASGSNGFESDNDAGGTGNLPITSPIFSNVTLIGPLDTTTKSSHSSDFKRAMHLRRNTKLSVFNSVFAGWPAGLYLDGSNTWANAQSGDLQIKNTILVGMVSNYGVPSGGSFTTTDVQTWFTDAARSNSTMVGPKAAKIFGAFLTSNEATAPVVLPLTGSALLSGASFTDSKLSDSFFTSTAFRGAFGTEDWTSGWVNWNPQQAAY